MKAEESQAGAARAVEDPGHKMGSGPFTSRFTHTLKRGWAGAQCTGRANGLYLLSKVKDSRTGKE